MANCNVNDMFRLGDWLVDVTEGTIQSHEVKHQLEPKMMSVLVELARHQGQLLTRQQLDDLVWPGVAVTNDALTRCIYGLRQRLGDSSRDSKYILTVSRRGYRLVMPVKPASIPSQDVQAGWLKRATGRAVSRIHPAISGATVVTVATLVVFSLMQVELPKEPGSPDASGQQLVAKDYFELGSNYLFAPSPGEVEKATELFQQAILLDESFADAYGGLADSYLMSSSTNHVDYVEALSRAERLLNKANDLDPDNPALLTSEAYLATFKGRYGVAKENLEKAIYLKPSHTIAYVRLGDLEMGNGRYRNGLLWYQRAAELEPLNPAVIAKVIDGYCYLGMYEEAKEWLVAKLPFADDPSPLFRSLSYLTSRHGLHDESTEWALKAWEIDVRDAENLMAMSSSYINARKFDQAFFWLDQLDMKREETRRLRYRLLMAEGEYEELRSLARRHVERTNCYCRTDGAYLSLAQLALGQAHMAQQTLKRVLDGNDENPVQVDASHYEHKIILSSALAASYLQQQNVQRAQEVLMEATSLIDFAEENGLAQAVVNYERWVVGTLLTNSGFITKSDAATFQLDSDFADRGAEDPRLRPFLVAG